MNTGDVTYTFTPEYLGVYVVLNGQIIEINQDSLTPMNSWTRPLVLALLRTAIDRIVEDEN